MNTETEELVFYVVQKQRTWMQTIGRARAQKVSKWETADTTRFSTYEAAQDRAVDLGRVGETVRVIAVHGVS